MQTRRNKTGAKQRRNEMASSPTTAGTQLCAAPKEQRGFIKANEDMEKALSHLGQALDLVRKSFSPAIGPERPLCDNAAEKSPCQSEYRDAMAAFAGRIHSSASSLEELCSRSEI
jgi:hypothetical protein